MRKNLLVVGAPRSGTSLTSAIFARQGYYVGEAERPAVRHGDDYNPFGYFEADDLIAANVALFRRVNYPHHNTWLFEAISQAAVEQIAELDPREEDRALLAAYQRCSPWLWKDPRLCLTLPYWSKLIDWTTTGVVFIRRDPMDVYWSFRRKGWCGADAESRRRVLERIAQHVETAEAALHQHAIPHLRLEYADFHREPQAVVKQINTFFNLQLSLADLNFRSELDHSSLRGRIAGYGRILLKKFPRRVTRRLESLVPQSLTAALFPERKHVSSPERIAANRR